MRALAAGLSAALFSLGGAIAAEMPNLERGRALYENHCVVCHTASIHGRLKRIPFNADELRQIVVNWQREEKLRWDARDVEDVVHFLRETRYKF